MIIIESILVVVGAVPRKPVNTKVMLLKLEDGSYELPHKPIDFSYNSAQVAGYLLNKYTHLVAMLNGVGWVPIIQKKVLDDIERMELGLRCISIPYVAMLPDLVTLYNNAEWYNLVDLFKIKIYKDHLQVINSTISER